MKLTQTHTHSLSRTILSLSHTNTHTDTHTPMYTHKFSPYILYNSTNKYTRSTLKRHAHTYTFSKAQTHTYTHTMVNGAHALSLSKMEHKHLTLAFLHFLKDHYRHLSLILCEQTLL